MGDLTLDLIAEGSLPFFQDDIDGHGAFRGSLRMRDEVTPNFTVVAGAAGQVGRENALSDAKVRLFRLQPDLRLLGHFKSGPEDFRYDVPELYLQYKPSPWWRFQVGRNYWDNTPQSRFNDWSYAGFTNGNLADASISIGLIGGNVSFHKPATPDSPADVRLSASAALGGRNEGLGLIQGLATFSLFDKYKMPGWASVVGYSLGLSYYPEGALPALLPGIPNNAAGGALSPSVYLQQGFGENFNVQVGYGESLPVIDPGSPTLTALKPRKALNASADLCQKYWGLHADYGRVWRSDLAGVTGTKIEDQFGLSGRWMILGDENRVLNLTLGGLFTHSDKGFGGGAYAAIELNVRGFSPGKL